MEGRRRRMVVGLGGRDTGGDRALSDKGVCAEAEGNNCRVSRIQQVPQVVGPRKCPHTGGEVGRVKQKECIL